MTIGLRIKKLRKKRKLTQRALALKCGWPNNGYMRIGNYESGYREPRTEVIILLANALNVAPGWLQFGDTPKTIKK